MNILIVEDEDLAVKKLKKRKATLFTLSCTTTTNLLTFLKK